MTSPQERLLASLSAHSLGAPFLFAPAHYRKGRGAVREPADIAWASNNVVVLINTTQGTRPYAEKVAHNLRQFRGWLRVWKSGRPLTGSNSYRDFSIGFGDYRYTLLLSVVDGLDAKIEAHHDRTREFHEAGYPVAGIFTVTEAVLTYLALNGGNARDLILLLSRLREYPPLNATQAIELVQFLHLEAMSVAQLGDVDLQHGTSDRLRAMIESIHAMRLPGDTAKGSNRDFVVMQPSGGDGPSIMNDIEWCQTLILAKAGNDALQQLGSAQRGTLGVVVSCPCPPYVFHVAAMHLDRPEEVAMAMVKQLRHQPTELYPPQGIVFLNSPGAVLPIYLSEPRIGPSATEQVLDDWANFPH